VEQGDLRGVVALDGPSGTGKSTVARRLASALRSGYLDTGAMYRVVTLAVLRSGGTPESVAASARIELSADPTDQVVLLDGEDVSAEIRGPEVTLKVYLTASADARAQRRSRQDLAEGRTASVEAVLADVQRRDRLDSTRAVSPLRQADDAVEVDTTELDLQGVVTRLLDLVESHGLRVDPAVTR
jgi:cytidylate kinase